MLSATNTLSFRLYSYGSIPPAGTTIIDPSSTLAQTRSTIDICALSVSILTTNIPLAVQSLASLTITS